MPHDYSRHLVLALTRGYGTRETRRRGDRATGRRGDTETGRRGGTRTRRRQKSKIKIQKSKLENETAQERPQGIPPAQHLYSNAYLGEGLAAAALGEGLAAALGEGVGVAGGPLLIGVP